MPPTRPLNFGGAISLAYVGHTENINPQAIPPIILPVQKTGKFGAPVCIATPIKEMNAAIWIVRSLPMASGNHQLMIQPTKDPP